MLTVALVFAAHFLRLWLTSFWCDSPQSFSDMSEVDLESYQGNMENVLAWLLEAEDHLGHQNVISNNVDKVKDQFHTHEVRVKRS